MKKTLYGILILALCSILLLGCESKEQPTEQEAESVAIQPAEKPDPEIGLISPTLDYSSEKVIVLHDYFGVFVYSLEEQQLLHSVDIKSLRYENVQGEGAVMVRYDEAKNSLALFSDQEDQAVEVNLTEGKVSTIDKQTFDEWSDANPKGKLTIEGTEAESLVYQPESGEPSYYPLKDAWK